jgi:hypothetical protein
MLHCGLLIVGLIVLCKANWFYGSALSVSVLVAYGALFVIECKGAAEIFGRKRFWRNPLKAVRITRQYLDRAPSWAEEAYKLYTDDELMAMDPADDHPEIWAGSRSKVVWRHMIQNHRDFANIVVSRMVSIEGRPWLLGLRPDLLPTANADAEFYQCAVRLAPKNLQYVLEEFQTFEMCEEAWSQDRSVADFVKNKGFQEVLLFA